MTTDRSRRSRIRQAFRDSVPGNSTYRYSKYSYRGRRVLGGRPDIELKHSCLMAQTQPIICWVTLFPEGSDAKLRLRALKDPGATTNYIHASSLGDMKIKKVESMQTDGHDVSGELRGRWADGNPQQDCSTTLAQFSVVRDELIGGVQAILKVSSSRQVSGSMQNGSVSPVFAKPKTAPEIAAEKLAREKRAREMEEDDAKSKEKRLREQEKRLREQEKRKQNQQKKEQQK